MSEDESSSKDSKEKDKEVKEKDTKEKEEKDRESKDKAHKKHKRHSRSPSPDVSSESEQETKKRKHKKVHIVWEPWAHPYSQLLTCTVHKLMYWCANVQLFHSSHIPRNQKRSIIEQWVVVFLHLQCHSATSVLASVSRTQVADKSLTRTFCARINNIVCMLFRRRYL